MVTRRTRIWRALAQRERDDKQTDETGNARAHARTPIPDISPDGTRMILAYPERHFAIQGRGGQAKSNRRQER